MGSSNSQKDHFEVVKQFLIRQAQNPQISLHSCRLRCTVQFLERRLEAMKNKHKKAKTEENEDFPGCEKIKFGDIQAPPKLVAIPKALKSSQDPSQERLRLKAVEVYRNRKGWASRPGIDLPPPILTPPSDGFGHTNVDMIFVDRYGRALLVL
ncbi:uncharacterized protein LOC114263330 [Camellia sinensis]|uniref:uncharacterized protein LOC114263330 n=1 Tax=Camellia sinensis TaxID=4442 RepID=UPI00103641B7|nr:uncharacterized protein LOC114263330 [Camellia sinensis]